MKKGKNMLVMLMLIAGVGIFLSFEAPYDHSNTAVMLILDKTDANNNLLKNDFKSIYEPIARAFGYEKGHSGLFSLSYVNAVGKSKEMVLSFAEPGKDFNPYRFTPAFRQFHRSLKDSLSKVAHMNFKEEPETRLFEHLCRRLQYLKDLKSVRKHCIIISDFLEKNKVDFYKLPYPKDLYARLCKENSCSFPNDLSGIEIWLISTRKNNLVKETQSAMHFFEQELKKRKAKVHIDQYLELSNSPSK